jgi:hypothetical protein
MQAYKDPMPRTVTSSLPSSKPDISSR